MKCPFCKAELAENSRFCLYCMTSLNEKEVIKNHKNKKWWLIILTAILLLLFLGFGIWALLNSNEHKPTDNNVSGIFENDEDKEFDTNTDSTESSDKNPNEDITGSIPDVEKESSKQSDKKEDTNTTENTTTAEEETTSSSTEKPTSTTTTTTTTTTAPAVQNETIENITWYYRGAYSNEYDKRYNQIETANAITIIGFKNIPSNGIFKVPETIDGKTVVSINMTNSQGYSFNDTSVKNKVKKVYLPPKLNKIWAGTFSECVNLTDLYIAGEYLYADPSVFPQKSKRTGNLTIHSSDSSWCLYGSKYFSVYCSQFGANEYYADWEEWNGGIYN